MGIQGIVFFLCLIALETYILQRITQALTARESHVPMAVADDVDARKQVSESIYVLNVIFSNSHSQ
jgi:hypothetical protein